MEDSVLYEVKLVEAVRMKQFTADQIAEKLKSMGVKKLVIDADTPSLIERLKMYFTIKKIIKLPREQKKHTL